MMWIDSIKPVTKCNRNVFSDIAAHHLPIVIYGAKPYAEYITQCLHEHGIEVYGYAVDKKYFTKNNPVYGRFLLLQKVKICSIIENSIKSGIMPLRRCQAACAGTASSFARTKEEQNWLSQPLRALQQ